MKKIYLHIGFPKTGTTAVQLFLRRNAQRLLKLGLLYPDIGYAFHHRFARCFMKNQDDPEVSSIFRYVVPHRISNDCKVTSPNIHKQGTSAKVELTDILSSIINNDSPVVVLSSEVFVWYWNRIDYKHLKQALVDFDIEIIAYLRPQTEYIEGTYIQLVQGDENCRTLTYEDFIEHYNYDNCDYGKILRKWESYFGIENITVIPFIPSELFKEDVKMDFLKRIGVPTEGIDYDHDIKFENASHSAVTTEILRILNEKKMPTIHRFNIRKKLFSFDRYIENKYGKMSNMDDREKKYVEARFLESNNLIAKRFLGKKSLFPETKFTPIHFKGLGFLQKEDWIYFIQCFNEGLLTDKES